MRLPFARAFDRFRGAGEAAPMVPALDGPFSPNGELELADVVHVNPGADNLVEAGGTIQFSSGTVRMGIVPGGNPAPLEDHGLPITAMAGTTGGATAIALKGGRIALRGPGTPEQYISLPVPADVTALAFDGDATLYASIGSQLNDTAAWTRDLLEKRRAGSLWRIDLASRKAERVRGDLAYPNGLLAHRGEIYFSEAWTSSVKRIAGDRTAPVTVDLPGYPARICKAGDGGFWLAVMAPRNQLLEFVLREPGYCRRMLAEVDPRYWIAPSLRPPASHLEPMQQGAQRVLGILKPWAPGFSVGLIVKFDPSGKPVRSLWSRADGDRHGITSVVESAGRLLFSSRAQNAVMSLALREDGR